MFSDELFDFRGGDELRLYIGVDETMMERERENVDENNAFPSVRFPSNDDRCYTTVKGDAFKYSSVGQRMNKRD